ncbi:MAG: Veg family protein [Bacilli bacterium]|nr:Veg family protein [Bacilli bacterium]
MIETIKNDIYNHLNKEVKIIAKENRNRNEIFYGDIIEIYSHVFIVSNGVEKKSYTYSDILAKDIQITFL